MTLNKFNEAYEEILHSPASDTVKNRKFSDLMTDMEREYKIPAMHDEAWERDNRAVIALYRKISRSRTI